MPAQTRWQPHYLKCLQVNEKVMYAPKGKTNASAEINQIYYIYISNIVTVLLNSHLCADNEVILFDVA